MHNKMKSLQEQIYTCVQSHIESAPTEELGLAVDMIKDLAQGIYYEMLSKKVEKELECMKKEEEEYAKMGKECLMYHNHNMPRDIDREHGRMYYSTESEPHGDIRARDPYKGRGMDHGEYEGRYREREVPFDFRDSREGRSPMSRKNYMESKELHKDKDKKMKELERYMLELSQDIVEMIEDASPEEKQMLEKKMTHLTSKISQLNANV